MVDAGMDVEGTLLVDDPERMPRNGPALTTCEWSNSAILRSAHAAYVCYTVY